MSYEVISASRADVARQESIERCTDLAAAIALACDCQKFAPAFAFYVFAWVTPKTRLLAYHTLYTPRGENQ